MIGTPSCFRRAQKTLCAAWPFRQIQGCRFTIPEILTSVCICILLSCPSHNFSHLRAHAFARSVTVGRQPCRLRLVDGRREGGPSSVAPRSHNPPTGRRRDSPISSSLFRTAHSCAQSVKGSPTEPALSRSSRQRLGHLQSHVD